MVPNILRRGVWVAIALFLAMTTESMALRPEETIASAARKVVKLYGAGGFRGLEAYQSGVLISQEGHVLTVMSTVLDSDQIDCVLDDGTRYVATLVGVDPRRELAVLSLQATDTPFFESHNIERSPPGTRIFALSNLFGVAVGDERVSAQHGVIATVIPLAARRGAYEAPYRGDVYLLDCTTNNPGSPGGALVDYRGRLIGMLGKELRSSTSGIWISYAIPIDELLPAYRDILDGKIVEPETSSLVVRIDPTVLGVVLLPDLLDKTPPFVESILPDSPAARADVRADDLVVAVGLDSVGSRISMSRALGRVPAGDPIQITVVRNGELIDLDLGPLPDTKKAARQ